MKILVFPKDPNPYQELLYTNLRRDDISIKYLSSPVYSHTVWLILLIPQLILYRIKGYSIFHLHWLFTFQLPSEKKIFNNKVTRLFFTIYFISFVFIIKLLRYKLVWTVHNILPHKSIFINDLFITKLLSHLCNAKIVHSKNIVSQFKKLNISIRNTYMIPIGNYINIYKNVISKAQARKYLKIERNTFVFTFIGLIKPYKGLEELVNEFLILSNQYNNIKLVIAGKCYDTKLSQLLDSYKKRYKNKIIIKNQFIADDSMQIYLNSADVIVNPFRQVTTSSSAILALSFSKPIICPRIGSLESIPEEVGYFYKISDKDGLYKCMQKSVKERKEHTEKSKIALKYAKTLSWDKIAIKTKNLYQSL